MKTQNENQERIIQKILESINSLNVFIHNDGGKVIFKKFDFSKKIVYIELNGNCSTCSLANENSCQKIIDFLKKSNEIIKKIVFIPTNKFDLGIVSSLHHKRINAK